MNPTLLILLVAGGAVFALGLGLSNLLFSSNRSKERRVRTRLDALAGVTTKDTDIERRHTYSDVPWLNQALAHKAWFQNLDRMLDQGRVNMNVGTLVLLCLTLGAILMALSRVMTQIVALQVVLGLLACTLPLVYVRKRRAKRMHKFAAQLPDALDLIGRALKAGHAFNQGMRMVADEFEDPIGPEFRKTLDEINFGISAEQALINLTTRVDCPDLKFFVVSVNIQRETGGNLSEIVSNIAHLVRERFKFQGRVKVLSAEGKLTAYILVALPFAIGVVIHFINPEYMGALYQTPLGRVMLTSAGVQMALGAAVLKKLIVIKV